LQFADHKFVNILKIKYFNKQEKTLKAVFTYSKKNKTKHTQKKTLKNKTVDFSKFQERKENYIEESKVFKKTIKIVLNTFYFLWVYF